MRAPGVGLTSTSAQYERTPTLPRSCVASTSIPDATIAVDGDEVRRCRYTKPSCATTRTAWGRASAGTTTRTLHCDVSTSALPKLPDGTRHVTRSAPLAERSTRAVATKARASEPASSALRAQVVALAVTVISLADGEPTTSMFPRSTSTSIASPFHTSGAPSASGRDSYGRRGTISRPFAVGSIVQPAKRGRASRQAKYRKRMPDGRASLP